MLPCGLPVPYPLPRGEVKDLSLSQEDLMSHWQLDLEGIELIEWNNTLSMRLLQYSRLLREDRTNRWEDSHWIELIEWNNTLSMRLLQYSRLLREDRTNRWVDSH